MDYKKLFFLSITLLIAGGCILFRTVEYETADGIALQKLDCKLHSDDNSGKIILQNNKNILTLQLNSRLADFNGYKIWFFSPVIADSYGDLRISKTDVEKIINPLFYQTYKHCRPIKKIVLDPGHGGEDSGAVNKGIKEKDLNLALCKKIKTALDAKGFEILLTRNDDTFVSLNDRSKFAKQHAADIFISIHHNASLQPDTIGTETYALTAAGAESTHNSPNISKAVRRGNSFDNANIILSHLIHSKVISNINTFDRGMKFARYKVLVQAPCPAILFEAGFVSNITEAAECHSEIRQKKTAEAIAAAVKIFAERCSLTLQ